MHEHKLAVIDSTIQLTNRWLNDVCAELQTGDPHHAYVALRSVLHALRDRLPVNLVAHLAAQLPILLRGVYYEGWDPAVAPQKLSRDEFLERIGQACPGHQRLPIEETVRAVFRVIRDHVSEGEVEKVLAVLPHDLRNLLVGHSTV